MNSALLPSLSIIVPTYQEAPNITELARRIHHAVADKTLRYEIIVVDDNSADGIEALVQQLSADGLPIRIIVRTNEKDLSTAVLAGFAQAQGDILICMDADLSHPPEKIPELAAKIARDEFQFAIGSRYVPGASIATRPKQRLLLSKAAAWLARPFTRISDPLSGFFALPRALLGQAKELNPVGFKIGLELMVKTNCMSVAEIPIHFADRRHGHSKLRLREQLQYLIHLSKLFRFKRHGIGKLPFLRMLLPGKSTSLRP